MSSAYGKIVASGPRQPLDLPLNDQLRNHQPIQLVQAEQAHLPTLLPLFNGIVEEGLTYPQEFTLTLEQFKDYFLSAHAFVALVENKVVGAFYIKPNFPGRCSHVESTHLDL